VEWLARLDAEHDNLRAALDRLSAAGETQLVLRLAGALVEYWFERTNFVELRQRLTSALAADVSPTAARAKALIGMSDTLSAGDDTEGARAADEEALAIYRGIGDRAGTADALWRLGARGDVRQGLPQLVQALALFNDVDDQQAALNVSLSLAWAYEQLGDRRRAEEQCRENLARARVLDNRYIAHASLGALATIAAEDGRPEQARVLAREHLPMPDEFGRLDLATAFQRAAYVLVRNRKWTAAVTLLAASEAIERDIQASQASIFPFKERARTIAAEQLDDVAFADAWDEGLSMTQDAARAFALAALE
jgi:tetratricopeptide (TPR) repeat protein